jgi:hypothetical protein
MATRHSLYIAIEKIVLTAGMVCVRMMRNIPVVRRDGMREEKVDE